MLNVLKLFGFSLTAIMLSCADYKELDLSIKKGEDIIDARDNTPYKTVIIGKQTWMAENLKYKYIRPESDTDIGKCYLNDPKNCQNLGRLYSWVESMDIEYKYDSTDFSSTAGVARQIGICPSGWHLPSFDEWRELLDYVGANSAIKLKTTDGWKPNNGTDEYGFSAVAAGYDWDGFDNIGVCGAWWSSSELNNKQIVSVEICESIDVEKEVRYAKKSWASIRCVKD